MKKKPPTDSDLESVDFGAIVARAWPKFPPDVKPTDELRRVAELLLMHAGVIEDWARIIGICVDQGPAAEPELRRVLEALGVNAQSLRTLAEVVVERLTLFEGGIPEH